MSTTLQAFHPPAPDVLDSGKSLAEYVDLLRRRRLVILVGFLLVFGAAAVTAWVLRPVYRSTATILIQEQEIPADLVRSTVTSYADERLQVISQQVMTRSVLLDLVDRHGLYTRERKRETSEEILDRMRQDIKITPISADVTDRRSGSSMKSMIAFSLAYDSEAPASAQKIASELTTLFLNENVKNRQQKAAETTSFLDEELARVGARISDSEQKLADFKQRNQGRLPELAQLNRAEAERARSDIERVERDINFAIERKASLEAQLAQTKATAPIVGNGGLIPDPEDRLLALQTQLASLAGTYSESHPDIKRLRREIANLQAQTGLTRTDGDRTARIDEARARLSELRQRYSEEHPDVRRQERLLAALEAAPAASAASRREDNPVYQTLKQQVATVAAQIEALQAERRDLRARLERMDARVREAPEVERGYFELARDIDSARARFRELREKQMQAQVAEQLERQRKAERFTLIDPPVFPERPVRPNRPVIVLIGLMLALAAGFGAGALREALDPTVHGTRHVVRVMRAPVLAVIPAVASPGMMRRRARRLRWALLVVVLLLGVGLAAVHFLYLPLDVAWYSVLRRLSN